MDEIEEILEAVLDDLGRGLNGGPGLSSVKLILSWAAGARKDSRRGKRVAPMNDLQETLNTASELGNATGDLF